MVMYVKYGPKNEVVTTSNLNVGALPSGECRAASAQTTEQGKWLLTELAFGLVDQLGWTPGTAQSVETVRHADGKPVARRKSAL